MVHQKAKNYQKKFSLLKMRGDYTLISTHQSGFRPGDSTLNQLLLITHEIYKTFENHQETRAVFLDISKAFDKVWHEGLLLKLKSNGIDGQLYFLIGNFLYNRYQRVVFNGKHPLGSEFQPEFLRDLS